MTGPNPRVPGANQPPPTTGQADDGDGDDALDGDASGATPPAGTDGQQADTPPDYEAMWTRERAERRRLSRRLAEQRQQEPPADVAERASAAERERDQARDELRRERAFNRIMRVASEQGAVDPDAVATMLLAAEDVEFDDQGRPIEVEQAVRELLRRKAYLKGPTAAQPPRAPRSDAGAGRGASGTNEDESREDFNSAFRRAAARSRQG
jgi:hypothetical protein